MAMIQEAASNSLSPWKLNNDENYKQDVKLKRSLSLVSLILLCLRRRNFQGNSEGVIQLKSQVAGKLSQFFTIKECQKKNAMVLWTTVKSFSLHYVKSDSLGAFLWDDPDQNQWSEITRIMVDQMNPWIHCRQGFIGSFDLPWSKWSWITDPDPDHPKGTHPKCNTHLKTIYNDNGQRLARSNDITDNYYRRKMGQKWLWFILTCRTCWK